MKEKRLICNRNSLMKVIMFLLVLLSLFFVYDKVNASQISYTISYNANGGTGAPAMQTKQKGKSVIISSKAPTQKGHKFLGWATTKTSKTVSYRPGSRYSRDKSVVLFAVWEPNVYVISFNKNGGNSAPASQKKIHGKRLELTKFIPKRSGYDFLGWSKSKTATYASYKPGGYFQEDKNTTLYAVWKLKTYKIYYNANGGNSAPQSQTKQHGKSICLRNQEPIRKGYKFAGWSEDKKSKLAKYKPGDKYSQNRDIYLYAVWFQVEFKVTYHANGGSGGLSSQTKKWNMDLTLSKNVPHRSGYTFLGWGLTAKAEYISYSPGDAYKTNKKIDLYAMWGKTKQKVFNDSHAFLSLAPGVEVVWAKFIYTEDYIRKGQKISFYNHRTALYLDLTKLNDERDICVYPPLAVTHIDNSKRELNKFVVNQRVDSLEYGDYRFSKVNRKKVSYDKDMGVIGSSGFTITYSSDRPWAPYLKMRLNNQTKQIKSMMNAQDNTEYYVSLGKIEGECIAKEGTNSTLRYSSQRKR